MSLLKSGIVVSINTLLCRIFGYLRDIFSAAYFGTSNLGDIFVVAYRLPNFFRALFAEGAFSSAFVPALSHKLVSEGKESTFNFANNIMTIMLIILGIVTCLIYLFLPEVMLIFAPGYKSNPEKFRMLVEASSITLPYMILICLCSLIAGILNSYDKFFLSSFLPGIANIIMIIFIVYFTPYCANPVLALCYGVIASGVIQLFIMIIAVRRISTKFFPCIPKLNTETASMFKNMLPAIISSGIVQINLMINTILASTIDGAAITLYYAERLNQFPLAIIGTALGTVLLPKLSRLIKSAEYQSMNDIFAKAIQIGLLLSLPACFALISLSNLIIEVLFQRGNFTANDTIAVADTLKMLAIGLPAFILQKVLTPRLLAKMDTKTPMKISALNITMNLAVGLALIQNWQYLGIAFATSISGWASVGLFFYLLTKDKDFYIDWKSNFIFLCKILISCLTMSSSLLLLKYFMDDYSINNKLQLLLLIPFGLIAYFSAILLLGIRLKAYFKKSIVN